MKADVCLFLYKHAAYNQYNFVKMYNEYWTAGINYITNAKYAIITENCET